MVECATWTVLVRLLTAVTGHTLGSSSTSARSNPRKPPLADVSGYGLAVGEQLMTPDLHRLSLHVRATSINHDPLYVPLSNPTNGPLRSLARGVRRCRESNLPCGITPDCIVASRNRKTSAVGPATYGSNCKTYSIFSGLGLAASVSGACGNLGHPGSASASVVGILNSTISLCEGGMA